MIKTIFTSSNKRRKLLIIVFIILFVLFLGFILDKSGKFSLFTHEKNNSNSTKEDEEAKTTSTAPSAQSDFSDGGDREPGNTLNENRGSAIVEETTYTNVRSSNPITSSTGEITAYSPSKNSTIKSGAILSGTSTLPRVEYRIIDSVSGVITTGSLVVKDGKFSGKISLDTNATEGRIDLFAVRSDFSEYSNVEIPIKFRD